MIDPACKTRFVPSPTGLLHLGNVRTALACLERGGDDFKAYAGAVGAATGAKGKSSFMPLWAVLTGVTHGPEMGRLWTLLGAARVRRRLEQAVEHLAS